MTCTRCLYDSTIPGITFDAAGVCSYCQQHDELLIEHPGGEAGWRALEEIAHGIRRAGRGKPYDVVVGVSGGCDSSYLLHITKERLGLRPLAVHFNNGWNAPVGEQNLKRVVEGLDVDLWEYKVDEDEYNEIVRAFFLAGLPDIEAPADIALAATLYRAAERHGIKHIFDGHSFRTEGMSPLGWLYMDSRYIDSVRRKHGRRGRLPTYPHMHLTTQLRWYVLRRIKKVRPLWHVEHNKEEVKRFLADAYSWQWYGGHHLENRLTAWYHSYWMPRRWGIDQRKNGFSALIRSGQMTREEGLLRLSEDPPMEDGLTEMVCERFGFSPSRMRALLEMEKHTYHEWPTYKQTFERLRPLIGMLARRDLVPMSFYLKYTKPVPVLT